MPRPFIPVPYTAHVTLKMQHVSQALIVQHNFDIESTDHWNTVYLGELADHFYDWFHLVYRQYITYRLQLISITVRSLESESAEVVIYVPTSPEYGTYMRDPEEFNVTKCFNLRTGYAGRSNRGRLFIPPLCDTQKSDPNHVTAAYAADVRNALEALREAIPTWHDLWGWVVVSYMSEGAWREVGTSHPVMSVDYVNLKINTQRRRLKHIS